VRSCKLTREGLDEGVEKGKLGIRGNIKRKQMRKMRMSDCEFPWKRSRE